MVLRQGSYVDGPRETVLGPWSGNRPKYFNQELLNKTNKQMWLWNMYMDWVGRWFNETNESCEVYETLMVYCCCWSTVGLLVWRTKDVWRTSEGFTNIRNIILTPFGPQKSIWNIDSDTLTHRHRAIHMHTLTHPDTYTHPHPYTLSHTQAHVDTHSENTYGWEQFFQTIEVQNV